MPQRLRTFIDVDVRVADVRYAVTGACSDTALGL
jgi:hypothetical protein